MIFTTSPMSTAIIRDAYEHQWGEAALIRPMKPKFLVVQRILIARSIRPSLVWQCGSQLRKCQFH